MERRGILVLMFATLLIGSGSGSPYGEFLRVLSGLEHNGKVKGKDDSPSPSPMPLVGGDQSVASLSRVPSKPEQNSEGPPVNSKTPQTGDGGGKGDIPGGNQKGGSVGTGTKEDVASDTSGDAQGIAECRPLENSCTVQSRLMACLRPGNGPSKLYLVVKNKGDNDLSVNIRVPSSVKIDQKELQLPKHRLRQLQFLKIQRVRRVSLCEFKLNPQVFNPGQGLPSGGWGHFLVWMVNISLTTQDSIKIVLDAGHGECILGNNLPEPTRNFFQNIPSYAIRMTPIYGAYILFSTVLIIGGIWTCCKFRRRSSRVDGGVPYQEIEMGLPQSSSAIEVDTADGWDQGWDDDWDDKPSTGTSEITRVRSISTNGLPVRTARGEGWDDDWDD